MDNILPLQYIQCDLGMIPEKFLFGLLNRLDNRFPTLILLASDAMLNILCDSDQAINDFDEYRIVRICIYILNSSR